MGCAVRWKWRAHSVWPGREPNRCTARCTMGTVRHRRFRPHARGFRYRLYLLYLDLV